MLSPVAYPESVCVKGLPGQGTGCVLAELWSHGTAKYGDDVSKPEAAVAVRWVGIAIGNDMIKGNMNVCGLIRLVFAKSDALYATVPRWELSMPVSGFESREVLQKEHWSPARGLVF